MSSFDRRYRVDLLAQVQHAIILVRLIADVGAIFVDGISMLAVHREFLYARQLSKTCLVGAFT